METGVSVFVNICIKAQGYVKKKKKQKKTVVLGYRRLSPKIGIILFLLNAFYDLIENFVNNHVSYVRKFFFFNLEISRIIMI